MKNRYYSYILQTLLFTAGVSPVALHAGTTWDGGGANTNINTAANWNDDTNPTLTGGGSTLTFGTGGSSAVINTDVSVAGIVINRNGNFEIADGAGSLTIGTGGITVTLPSTTGRTHTISESSLTVSGNQNWSVTNNTGTAQLNVSSVLAGSGNITKTGNGIVQLSGNNNSYTGNINVNAGTLQFATGLQLGASTILNLGDTSGNADATINWANTTGLVNNNAVVVRFGSSGTKSLNVVSGGATSIASLELNDNVSKGSAGTLTVSGATTLAGAGIFTRTINVNSGALILTGAVGQSGGTANLIKSGTGSLTLTAARGYSGTTEITGGNLTLGSGWNTASVNSFFSNLVTPTSSGTLTIDSSGGSISQTAAWNTGTMALGISGNRTLTLNQANTIGGNVTVNAGTGTGANAGVLRLAHSDALGTTAKTLSVNGGNRRLELEGGITLGTHISMNLQTNSGDGNGIVNISGNNRINGSMSMVNGGVNFASNAGGSLTLAGNILMPNTVTQTQNLFVTFGGASTGNNSVSGNITNNNTTYTFGVVKAGSGNWSLAGDNNYNGATTIQAGVLIVGSIANGGTNSNIGASSSAATNLVFDGGTLRYTGATIASDRAFTVNASRTAIIDVSTAGTNLSLVGATGTATNGALTKQGAGKLTLTGSNTYTGATTVSAGSLVVNGSLASTSVVVESTGSLGGSGVLGSAVLSGSGSINPGNSPGVLTASSVDVAGGLDFNFEFNVANGMPTWNAPTASGNDVLRLTGGTPFSGTMNTSNVINIFLNVGSLTVGDTFTGGFYTDVNADFMSVLSGATVNYFLADVGGLTTYEGNTFTSYTGPLTFEMSTIQQTADFGSGNITGRSMQFTVVPETSVSLLGGLSAMLLLRRRRSA